LPADDLARLIRFANRVPLLYQQSHCCIYRSLLELNWRSYGLTQSRGALPAGPLVIMVHIASVWVPFTSESKEAIADYDEIRKEVKLALQECARKLASYLRRRARQRREGQRRSVFQRYIVELAEALKTITGASADRLRKNMLATARKLTLQADVHLDENGKPVKPPDEDASAGDNTVIIHRDQADHPDEDLFGANEKRKPARSANNRRTKRRAS